MREDKPILLVVDDEPDFLDLFVKRFSKRGYAVSAADGGLAALRHVSENPVDVVILDVKMPGMNGIEALKELKKRHPLVEVIMLTGHGSVESGLQGISHGAYDYVMKPFELDDLIYKIDKAYERRLLQLPKEAR